MATDIDKLLKRSAAAVGAVFASFSGFLLHAQPPEQALSGFAVGFASTISSLLFLTISVIADRLVPASRRKIFTVLSFFLMLVATGAGVTYQRRFVERTFDCPALTADKLIRGAELTDIAQTALKTEPRSECDLLLDFGGLQEKELVWTRHSLDEGRLLLSQWYLVLAVSVAGAVFSVAEALRR
jgi:hypothetical protein